MTFSQGMLTEAASAELELELRRLRSRRPRCGIVVGTARAEARHQLADREADVGAGRFPGTAARRVTRDVSSSAWGYPESYAKWHFIVNRITTRYE